MLNAARAHGIPMMVIAMITPAITQPSAIQKPPNRIHNRLSRNETGDMASLRGWRGGDVGTPGLLRHPRLRHVGPRHIAAPGNQYVAPTLTCHVRGASSDADIRDASNRGDEAWQIRSCTWS